MSNEQRELLATWRCGATRACAGVVMLGAALVACGKDRASDDVPPIVSADTSTLAAPPAGDPITDIIAIVTVPDRAPLVGRRVTLSGMKVQTVTGPNTFWVGPNPDQQLFVVRSGGGASDSVPAQPVADTSRGARVGQTVSVSGVIRPLPGDLEQVRAGWSLSTANEATLTRERVYLDADRVDVTGM
jgi:hypothetical protein